MVELSQGKGLAKVNCQDAEVLSSLLIPRGKQENVHSKIPLLLLMLLL